MNKKKALNIGAIILGVLMLPLWSSFTKFLGISLIVFGSVRLIIDRRKKPVEDEPVTREEDIELNTEIKNLQRNVKAARFAFGVGCVFVVIGIIIAASAGTAVPVIIFAIISGIIKIVQSNYESKLKDYVSNNIVKQALEAVFQDINYQPGECLPDNYIYHNNLGLADFDRFTGNDYVKGTYKGLNIEMSDVTLISVYRSTDEDGNEQESENIVFKGLWLVCDFGKELSADLTLSERGKFGKLFGGDGIKTENEKFNKHFYIGSEIEHEAFYILTPHMMEYILEMDKKADGVTHICFSRNGKVQIAIDSGRDSFEVRKGETDATCLRRKFIREIRYATDLIDELRLVETLYKK